MSKVVISFIDGVSREIDIDGVEFAVATADMDQILAMLGYVGPLQKELAAAPKCVIEAINGFPLADDEKLSVTLWAMTLIGTHRDAVRQIVAIGTRQPIEVIGKLLPDRMLALLLMLLEVNADFFSRMLPNLLGLAARTALASGVAGLRPPAAATAAASSDSTGLQPSSS